MQEAKRQLMGLRRLQALSGFFTQKLRYLGALVVRQLGDMQSLKAHSNRHACLLLRSQVLAGSPCWLGLEPSLPWGGACTV